MHGVISAGRADEAFAGAKNAPHRLSHLAQLEAESIYIMREAIAESDNPVLLYSIGKDFGGAPASGAEGFLSGANRHSRCCTSIRPGNSAR